MITEEVLKKLGYEEFEVLKEPKRFRDLCYGRDIELVQTYGYIENECVLFNGAFTYQENRIHSLDGDYYNDNLKVLALCWDDAQTLNIITDQKYA